MAAGSTDGPWNWQRPVLDVEVRWCWGEQSLGPVAPGFGCRNNVRSGTTHPDGRVACFAVDACQCHVSPRVQHARERRATRRARGKLEGDAEPDQDAVVLGALITCSIGVSR